MQVKWLLHSHGPWDHAGESLVYSGGNYIFESQSTHGEETEYMAAKVVVFNMIKDAVDEQLGGIPVAYRNQIIDAIATSWVTKVNFAVMRDNTTSAGFKLPLTSGGLEVRADSTIHYWTDESVDKGDVKGLIKAQLKIIIQKLYDYITANVTGADRQITAMRLCLIDFCNQFGVEVTE